MFSACTGFHAHELQFLVKCIRQRNFLVSVEKLARLFVEKIQVTLVGGKVFMETM